jgi:hypothetical protein
LLAASKLPGTAACTISDARNEDLARADYGELKEFPFEPVGLVAVLGHRQHLRGSHRNHPRRRRDHIAPTPDAGSVIIE